MIEIGFSFTVFSFFFFCDLKHEEVNSNQRKLEGRGACIWGGGSEASNRMYFLVYRQMGL